MKTKLYTSALFALTLVGGALLQSMAIAEETNPIIAERQAVMKALKDGMGSLGGMAKGSIEFNDTQAQAALDLIKNATANIAATFETNALSQTSESAPAIWENWPDFVAKSDDLDFALEGWDVTSLDALRAGMGNVGATCSACHKAYRIKKN